jgi:hypothetical protein
MVEFKFLVFLFLIFDFNDPELVKIYSLVFPFSFSIKLSLLTFTLWIMRVLASSDYFIECC